MDSLNTDFELSSIQKIQTWDEQTICGGSSTDPQRHPTYSVESFRENFDAYAAVYEPNNR